MTPPSAIPPSSTPSGSDAPGTAPVRPTPTQPALPERPGIARRLAAFLYEGVLLFGVVMIVGLFYAGLTQQRNAMVGRAGLMATLFVVLGLYFVWFWTHGGQTVAMKAWHTRLVRSGGDPVSPARAAVRYVLSWLWFLPALAIAHYSGLHTTGAILGAITVGVLAYAALAWLHPQRQFWHDAVCGTQLITQRPVKRPKRGR